MSSESWNLEGLLCINYDNVVVVSLRFAASAADDVVSGCDDRDAEFNVRSQLSVRHETEPAAVSRQGVFALRGLQI